MSEIIHRFIASPGDCNHEARPGGDQAWLAELLDPYTNPWHCFAEVVEDYMPPYPRPDTKPSIQVRWGSSYLRKGGSPLRPYFWDIYGHEFRSVQQAWIALAHAPAPPRLTYANRGNPSGPDHALAAPPAGVGAEAVPAVQPPQDAKRKCNRHEDCDEANRLAAAAGRRTDHCHDDCCEDCFGS